MIVSAAAAKPTAVEVIHSALMMTLDSWDPFSIYSSIAKLMGLCQKVCLAALNVCQRLTFAGFRLDDNC